jgi:hypothetical protein
MNRPFSPVFDIFTKFVLATTCGIVSLGLIPNAAHAEMFLRDRAEGWALNVWKKNPIKIDGFPRVDVYQRNDKDAEQQWDRLQGKWGTMWRLSGTNWCLNAHYLSNGANINVWNCNENDPDQNWSWVEYDYKYQPSFGLQRTLPDSNGRYFCLNASDLRNNAPVTLQQCNQNQVTQRWKTPSRL